MGTRLLPPGHDSHRPHQLVFELVPTAAVAVVSRQWLYVTLAAAILLPAVRGTWVWWVRSGVGVKPTIVAAIAATFVGAGAVAAVWLTAGAVGVGRLLLGSTPRTEREAEPQALPVSRR